MVIHLQGGIGGQHLGDRVPNPANPMEYCSTIPPHLQVCLQTLINSLFMRLNFFILF